MSIGRLVLIGVGVIILGFVAIQFVPVERTNPPVTYQVNWDSPETEALARAACMDCHSNESVWPWYSNIAPVSWLVAHDVKEGREHLNFSNWDLLDLKDRAKAREEIWEEVEDGEMPLWYYLPAHPDARLSSEDLSVIRAWAVTPGPM